MIEECSLYMSEIRKMINNNMQCYYAEDIDVSGKLLTCLGIEHDILKISILKVVKDV